MRYFLECAYLGTAYSGFQVQANANSVQAEIEKALAVFFRKQIMLTGSSRTDAGVHALQNYFHFDIEAAIPDAVRYNLNALLPEDISIRRLVRVPDDAHCRFDATSRRYRYVVYREKNPFYADRAYYYPYRPDLEKLQAAAALLPRHTDFTAFAKRNTQVKTFDCRIFESAWREESDQWIFEIRANRFLRGMVRGLVGTMLLAGRGLLDAGSFESIILARDPAGVNFNVPGHGLYLVEVAYPDGILRNAL